MTFKEKIHRHYLQIINEKIGLLNNVMADLKESSTNETKSTAGDKHETALAMLQIEQANTRTQLAEMLEQKAVLEKLNPAITTPVILNGSLVKTNKGYFYLSTALGKAVVDGIPVMAISAQSPLGKKIMSLKAGVLVEINSLIYVVESIE
ncbi:MAG: hypothetical protein IPP48_12750 [Chitinophagaceae bacterium]|nr:hypothetical protein [Chitinophagaceae bacterium]